MTDRVIWDFQGMRVLVTGGSRGIGRSIVRKLVYSGADVIFTYANCPNEAHKVIEDCAGYKGHVEAFKCELKDRTSVKEMVGMIRSRKKLDCLINNAGIYDDAPVYAMSEQQWDDVIQVNLSSLFLLTRSCIKALVAAQGKIVNITSTAGILGAEGQANYAASKAGVIGFTKSLAKELGPMGVRVNAVAPGFTNTEMFANIPEDRRRELASYTALKRMAEPEEIASTVLFLISDVASYITGKTIMVDGGLG